MGEAVRSLAIGPRLSLRAAALAAVVALAACSTGSGGEPGRGTADDEGESTTAPGPATFQQRVADFNGYPAIATASTGDCRRVLAIGDSLMVAAESQLADILAGTGRCVDVVGEARNSSGPAGYGGGVRWTRRLPDLLTEHAPDVVVISFIGNSTIKGGYESPRYVLKTRLGTLALIDQARAFGAAVSVSVPPPAIWFCNPLTPETAAWRAYRTWVLEELPHLRPDVEYADWNPVLGPDGEYAHALRFPDGQVRAVRENDCTHLLQLGAYQGAWAVASSIAPQWHS